MCSCSKFNSYYLYSFLEKLKRNQKQRNYNIVVLSNFHRYGCSADIAILKSTRYGFGSNLFFQHRWGYDIHIYFHGSKASKTSGTKKEECAKITIRYLLWCSIDIPDILSVHRFDTTDRVDRAFLPHCDAKHSRALSTLPQK